MEFSIIIPVYNEERSLAPFLISLEKFRGAAEIIFSDGGSTDRTVDMIKEAGFFVASGSRGRGTQLNLGARISHGDNLLFLHSDSFLPDDALDQMRHVLRKHKWGCFGISFNSKSVKMKICEKLSNRRVRRKNIAFGDQGIFIKRQTFFDIGAFPNIPVMEDLQLSINMTGAGERIGMTKDRISTSDRRFRKGGPWRTMYKMYRLRKQYLDGVDIAKIAAQYRDAR